ncbi:MAG: sigma-70 family RNA polymerase sigma factor [Acidobacteriaceae bacterium]|nr:sigma-70 family RNA polymerase sigma factor [Acidobacteriaceae bacterium]
MTAVEVRSGDSGARPVVWANDSDGLDAPNEARSFATADSAPCLPGQVDDLDLLFDCYARLVRATAFRVLGDANEAEEVVQDVFLYLYRKPERFDPLKGTLKAWIVKITICRALDRRAYLSRRRIIAVNLDSLDLAASTDLETEMESRFNRKHLEAALADLPSMQRLTIQFFYFHGLNLKEISSRLRQPLGNVRHHFYRGLEHLRQNDVLHRLRSK